MYVLCGLLYVIDVCIIGFIVGIELFFIFGCVGVCVYDVFVCVFNDGILICVIGDIIVLLLLLIINK